MARFVFSEALRGPHARSWDDGEERWLFSLVQVSDGEAEG